VGVFSEHSVLSEIRVFI